MDGDAPSVPLRERAAPPGLLGRELEHPAMPWRVGEELPPDLVWVTPDLPAISSMNDSLAKQSCDA